MSPPLMVTLLQRVLHRASKAAVVVVEVADATNYQHDPMYLGTTVPNQAVTYHTIRLYRMHWEHRHAHQRQVTPVRIVRQVLQRLMESSDIIGMGLSDYPQCERGICLVSPTSSTSSHPISPARLETSDTPEDKQSPAMAAKHRGLQHVWNSNGECPV